MIFAMGLLPKAGRQSRGLHDCNKAWRFAAIYLQELRLLRMFAGLIDDGVALLEAGFPA